MFKFLAQLFLLVSILLFGILLGLQQAQQGIFSIEGFLIKQEPTKAEQYYIKKIDGEEVEVAVGHEHFSLEMLLEKEERWQERYHYNRWSQLGNRLGNFFYTLSRHGFDWLIAQIDKLV